MKTICPFCSKEMSSDVRNPLLSQFFLYVCNQCLAPNSDTMYKELYCALTYESGFNKIVSEKLISRAIFFEDYYITIDYDLKYRSKIAPTKTSESDCQTIIYKNIIGTIATSINFEPIYYDASSLLCKLDFVVNFPLHDLGALRDKLKTYVLFS